MIIETIKESLNNVKFKSFSVHLNDVDVFPNENYIRVIWIGLEPEENILELQKNIDESLKSLFRKEKDFKPHLTLARGRSDRVNHHLCIQILKETHSF